VGVLHLGVAAGAAPGSEDRRQTGDRRGVSGAVAGVDVVGPDGHPHELLGDEIDLVRRFGAGEEPDGVGPARFDGPGEAGRGGVEGLVPRGRRQLPAPADERLGESLVAHGITVYPAPGRWFSPGT